MINLNDMVTLVYGVVGFVIGWLWGRYRSALASFMASIVLAAIGFGAGKALGWLFTRADFCTDKLAQQYKILGSSLGIASNIVWLIAIIAIPVVAIAASNKANRRAAAELEPPSRPRTYR